MKQPSPQLEREPAEVVLTCAATLQQLFESVLPPAVALELRPEEALERARIAFGSAAERDRAQHTTLEILAAQMLAGIRLDLARDLPAARELVNRLDAELGVHRISLSRELLRAPELLSLPPLAAVSAQLSLLVILTPLEEVSLWIREPDHQLRCVSTQGGSSDDPGTVELARSLLSRNGANAARGELVGLRLERWRQPVAAMVGRASADAHAQVRAMFETAAPVLAAVLERDDFLTQQAQVEQSLVESKDRQLTRLGLDLHDGPLQDVAALATDLRLFRRQLTQSLRGTEHERVLAGRMDDLEAQLVAVDADLRRLATSLQSPFLLHQDFPRALREAAESFSAATGIEPSVTLSGDLGVISESQQLALLAILREGLNNIREHSGARRVTISVTVDDAGVHAEMSDDGSGFDVESTLFRAARDGHVGLVGMQERVRLLNGRSHIESRPGGPTTITVSMPEWRPARP